MAYTRFGLKGSFRRCKVGVEMKRESGSKGDVGSQVDKPRDVSSDVRNPESNPACSALDIPLPP